MIRTTAIISGTLAVLFAGLTITPARAAVVATGQYNNYRNGANLNESTLNLYNVGTNTFGRTGSFAVDGEVRAQPLYVPSVVVNGASKNVLFVATMHNSVYAFDAAQPGSQPLWHINFGASVPAFYASSSCPNSANSGPELGILSTPVIDTTNGILYAVYTTTTGANSYSFYIAAIDIKTGLNKSGSPAPITASVPGSGYDAVGGTVSLNQKTYIQRPALALSNGDVYVGLGSCGPDPDPYHGWVLGYSAANVSVQTSVYNATPNGSEGAIWQSGRGLVVDGAGNVYASTGNGTNASGCSDLRSCDSSDSVIKFSPSGQPTGVYTDPNYAALSQYDLDLSSSGPLYVASTGLILAGGKEGIMHVLNASAIGGANAVVQNFQATQPCGTYKVGGCYHIASLVYWDNAANPLLYVWANQDTLRAYRWNGSQFNTTPDSQSPGTTFYPGGTMALSANGSDPNTAILWAMTPDNIMHAFQATNVGSEIYNTNQNSSRDAPGTLSRFVVPTVADGHVYVATLNGQVQVYGLLGTPPPASASFVKLDATTQGNWSQAYGAEGYNVVGDQAANPTYAAPGASGQSTWVWANSTTDPRALQKASNLSDRVAATWYSGSSFLINSNITDTNQHQVALYCLDWDSTSRRQTIDVLDTSGNVLNTQTLTTSFNGGVYLVWNVTGPVIFRITWNAGFNGVVEGIFFGGAKQAPLASATFLKTDTATQGTWSKAYGAEGYNVIGDQALNPSYAAPAASGEFTFTWAASTTDPRALQKPSNLSDRVAATWYSGSSFLIDTNITDTNQHQVALYCLDWDTSSRQQTIDVLDTAGNVLNTQALTTSFYGGAYLVWNVKGHVIFRVTWNAGYNAVVEGIFFGGAKQSSLATATFSRTDTATQGNWRTAYGADGYNVVGNTFSNPAYAAPVASGESTWVWANSTTDTRALQKANAGDRVAATWYSGSSFLIDTNISDGNQHQVALYCLDWDTTARQQTIDVLDTAGNILDTRTLATSFNGGVYLVWNVTGHVIFRVTWTAGQNAVVQGLFFGSASSQTTHVGTASFLKTDTSSQGNWEPYYGSDGWVVVGDATGNPPYGAVAASGQSTWVWASSTTDVRALQKWTNPNDRVAAAWYSQTPFLIDTNITDANTHQVELYCLDWDGTTRRQTIDVLDANGNVLNTQALTSSFNGGVYLVWNVTGHVTFRVTWTAGANAVVQGVFFGGP